LVIATSNRGKLEEFRALLEGIPVRVHTIEEAVSKKLTIVEDGATFVDNAIIKAKAVAAASMMLTLADDSGLEVDALGGAPGVYSARFAGPDATDEANNRLVISKMRGETNRRARFVCVVALASRGELIKTFRGEVEGELLDEPRGPNGFGYDPLFFYPPLGRTFAELTQDQKFAVSHRGHALRKLFTYLAQLVDKTSGPSDKIG